MTITGKVVTNLDKFKNEKWPNKFAEVPKIGSYVKSESGEILKVAKITLALLTITLIFILTLTPALADVFVTNTRVSVKDEPDLLADTIKLIEPGTIILDVEQIDMWWVLYKVSEVEHYIPLSQGKLFRKAKSAQSYIKEVKKQWAKEQIEEQKREQHRILTEQKRHQQMEEMRKRSEKIRAHDAKEKEKERKQFKQKIAKFPQKIQQLILAKKISLGMTKEQVRLSWGSPKDINRSAGSWGVHEQWVYGPYSISNRSIYIGRDSYVYFENGILTGWQD